MKDLINSNNTVTMSSREIAELTGKMHKHVLRDIELTSPNLDRLSKSTTYVDSKGETRKEWLLSKRDNLTPFSGYSEAALAKIIDLLREIEIINEAEQGEVQHYHPTLGRFTLKTKSA